MVTILILPVIFIWGTLAVSNLRAEEIWRGLILLDPDLYRVRLRVFPLIFLGFIALCMTFFDNRGGRLSLCLTVAEPSKAQIPGLDDETYDAQSSIKTTGVAKP